MLDPISSLKAPPPRYLLESDSSDEEGQGAYGASAAHTSRAVPPAPVVSVSPVPGASGTSPLKVASAVVAIGQAGAYLLRRASSARPLLSVTVDSGRAGTVFSLDSGAALIALNELDNGDAAYAVVEAVLGAVGAESW